ncbi:MAG: hypothetical protein C4547_11020 [Phycisphaerales bacterium]|nr:MAG: hypothetical protein C4547_11020 [Phycisphaerales bacterium]
MSKWFWLQLTMVLVAAAATFISLNLFKKHFGQPVSSWFDAACGESDEPGGANCEKVIKSEWGTIRYGHLVIPTALLGVVYYASLATWLLGVGRPSRRRRWLHVLPSLMVAAGFFFSVFLTYKMIASDHWCPWCLVTHGCNLLLLIGIALLWLGYDDDGAATVAAPAERTAAATAEHPGMRAAGMTLLAMAAVSAGLWFYAGYYAAIAVARQKEREARKYESYVKEVQQDATTLMTNWELGQKYDFKITDESAVRILSKAPSMQMVVFSDFECPFCRRFAVFIEERIQPLFANRMMIAYKHYPLNARCNPRVKSYMHKNACWAGAFAEAARLQQGNEKFWDIHDYFYHDPSTLRGATDENNEARIRSLAARFGLDPDRVIADMQSPELGAGFLADIEEAAAAGVTSTPGVFVNGKKVNQLAIMQWPFWREMARLYWKTVNEEPPAEVTELLNSLSPPKKEAAGSKDGTEQAGNGVANEDSGE